MARSTRAAKSPKPAAKGKAPAKVYCAREDFGMPVDDFIAGLDASARAILIPLRALVRKAAPAAGESIKWGMPVYTQDGYLCYLQACKGYVRFGFYQGVQLDDKEKLLEGTGAGSRHVKLRSVAEIRPGVFSAWVKGAAEINRKAATRSPSS